MRMWVGVRTRRLSNCPPRQQPCSMRPPPSRSELPAAPGRPPLATRHALRSADRTPAVPGARAAHMQGCPSCGRNRGHRDARGGAARGLADIRRLRARAVSRAGVAATSAAARTPTLTHTHDVHPTHNKRLVPCRAAAPLAAACQRHLRRARLAQDARTRLICAWGVAHHAPYAWDRVGALCLHQACPTHVSVPGDSRLP